MKTKLTKGLTLFIFFGLIFGFVSYKAGYWTNSKSKSISQSPNGGVISQEKTDTLKKGDIILKEDIHFSSSKSAVIFDQVYMIEDTINHKKDSIYRDSIKRLKKKVMSSSKSAIIFDPIITIDSSETNK